MARNNLSFSVCHYETYSSQLKTHPIHSLKPSSDPQLFHAFAGVSVVGIFLYLSMSEPLAWPCFMVVDHNVFFECVLDCMSVF